MRYLQLKLSHTLKQGFRQTNYGSVSFCGVSLDVLQKRRHFVMADHCSHGVSV